MQGALKSSVNSHQYEREGVAIEEDNHDRFEFQNYRMCSLVWCMVARYGIIQTWNVEHLAEGSMNSDVEGEEESQHIEMLRVLRRGGL